ncbi:hypothetical protein PJ985_20310 [Streptomyces sp. ACA25]|uniref:hypothetical protein n=1 Tax=Streptomyces sp. ACA25 TaxID=3022596 RepID=UPI00230782E5|nr:hypothetical protein [Streptomyces sp. ACA25]MDB1089904.1 hypothetical protein [Streptomyces sp. ACA25]
MTERDQERGDGRDPIDEDAAWAEIVAGFGKAPAAEPETRTGEEHSGRAASEEHGTDAAGTAPDSSPGAPAGSGEPGSPRAGGGPGNAWRERPEGGPDEPLLTNGSGRDFLTTGSGQWSGTGPRDWAPEDEQGEGHFVPPEPPPLPASDLTTKFAWLAVIGGPVLLFLWVVFQQPVTWWVGTLGIGGFLVGFATLVSRMRDGRDEWSDPGSGAVV